MLPPNTGQYRCIELLEMMSDGELRAVKRSLESPYFRLGEAHVKLVRYLLRLAPGFPAEKLAKPALFRRVYGRAAPYREKTIRDLLSDVALHFDELLAFERVRADRVLRRWLVLEETVRRGDGAGIRRELRRFDQEISRRPDRSVDYWRDRSYADRLRAEHPADSNLRGQKTDLNAASASLDKYLLLRKVQTLLALINRERILGTRFEFSLQQEVIALLERQDHPVFTMYGLLLKTIRSPNDVQAERLVELLREHWTYFSATELSDFVALTTNAIVRSSEEEDLEATWALDEFYIERVIPQLPGGSLPMSKAINVYGRGIKLNRLEEGITLALSMIPYTYPHQQLNASAFLQAHYQFTRHQPLLAYDHIRDFDLTESQLGIHVRDLQLRILFELRSVDPVAYESTLESALEAASKYYKRYTSVNLIGITKMKKNTLLYNKLYSIIKNRKGRTERLASLCKEVEKLTSGNIKEWFIAQLERL